MYYTHPPLDTTLEGTANNITGHETAFMKPLFKAEQYLTFSSFPSAQNDHLATDFLEGSLFSGFCLGTNLCQLPAVRVI